MSSSVVVVDDDHSILELMQLLLESEGYQVRTFESGEEAHEAATGDVPDVFILDLMMPGMDGMELIHLLRHDPQTEDVPILVCSAYYSDLRKTISELGREKILYLRKPFQIEQLLDSLGRLLAKRPSRLSETDEELLGTPPATRPAASSA